AEFHVRLYTAAAQHLAPSFGYEGFFQRIGYATGAAVQIPVAIVYRLNATTAGSVVFGNGEFQLGIIAKFFGYLYQSFAIGIGADKHASVQVLQGAGYNLRCRSRIAVYQYRYGNFIVPGNGRRTVFLVHFLQFAFGRNDKLTFIYK